MGSVGELLLNLNNSDFDVITQYAVLQSSLASISDARNQYYQTKIDELQNLINDNNKLLSMNISTSDRYKITDYINVLNAQINALNTNIKKLTEITMVDILKTHNMFLDYTFKPFVASGVEYITTQYVNTINFGSNLKISIPIYGDFITQPVLAITLKGFFAIDPKNKVKYCKFLGHKLLSRVGFINEGILKDYIVSEDYNMYYNNEVDLNHKDVWKKCVGEELPIDAYFNQDPLNNEFREMKKLYYGAQTPKREQDDITVYIPLIFWFYEDSKALPNSSLNKDTTLFNIQLAQLSDICTCLDYGGSGGLFNPPTISSIVLYTKHLFVSDEVVSVFKDKDVNCIVRLRQSMQFTLNKSAGSINLNSLTYPIKAIFITVRPVENEEGADRFNTWNINKLLKRQSIMYPVVFNSGLISFGYNTTNFYTESEVLTSLSLATRGINIFYDNNIGFFSRCLPLTTGLSSSNNYILNFSNSLSSNTGFLNPANIAALTLNYVSDNIDVDNPAYLYISTNSINIAKFSSGKIEFLM